MNFITLKTGDVFTYKGEEYEVFKIDETFITCKNTSPDGYTFHIHKSVEITDEHFKSNPDHKRNML
tara:strand:- start:94 stop:291 length:198 start_codon:yes stop_codon:yes gene_type:complete